MAAKLPKYPYILHAELHAPLLEVQTTQHLLFDTHVFTNSPMVSTNSTTTYIGPPHNIYLFNKLLIAKNIYHISPHHITTQEIPVPTLTCYGHNKIGKLAKLIAKNEPFSTCPIHLINHITPYWPKSPITFTHSHSVRNVEQKIKMYYLNISCTHASTHFPCIKKRLLNNIIHQPQSNLFWALPTTTDPPITQILKF